MAAGYARRPGAPVATKTLTIALDGAADVELASAWPRLCRELATRLTAGNGPGGLGAFHAVDCGAAGPAAGTGAAWRLTIKRESKALRASLFFDTAQKAVGSVALPVGDVRVLQDKVLLDIWALALLDTLPMAWTAPSTAQDAPRNRAKAPIDGLLPSTLTLFALSFEPKAQIWRAEVVGQAQGRAASWDIALRPGRANAGAAIYGQRVGGSGTAIPALIRQFRARLAELKATDAGAPMRPENEAQPDDQESLQDELWRTATKQIAAGFAGFRYGVELVDPKTSTLPRRTLASLLAEFRSGIFEGMRTYWDYVPTVKKAYEGETLAFGYSRILLGYGFGYQLPPGIARFGLRRLELAPKLGIWNLTARLPVASQNGEVKFEDFRIKSTFGFGFELSGEVGLFERASSFWNPLIRPWYARDLSSSALGDNLSSNVSSQRLGLDLFWKGPRLGEVLGLSFMLFSFYETVDVGGRGFSIGTVAAYGGGGATIDW